jgi:uncharacterized protein YabN with tetrapyrrole methylase and pyrophosphatase domain
MTIRDADHGSRNSTGAGERIALYEIDRIDHIDHLTTLVIPPSKGGFMDLKALKKS